MSLLNPRDPLEVHVAKQNKIIEALMRRASRQEEPGRSAFVAFQSAIDLQQRVDAQSRDLARATTELESERYDRARTRRALIEALSSMDEGFALFIDGHLNIYNDLFANLLPDQAGKIDVGLSLEEFFELLAGSCQVKSMDRSLSSVHANLRTGVQGATLLSVVIELERDLWYQLIAQNTAPENTLLLLTEITPIVRRNRVEKKTLIDRQAGYLQAVFEQLSSGICTFSAVGEVMMFNPQFHKILNVPPRVLSDGATLHDLLEFMGRQKLVKQMSFLRADQWRNDLDTKGWLRKRVNHGDGRVVDIHANLLPNGGFVVELMDVTLEARTTETLENRVMERTAELTRANKQLIDEYEQKVKVEEQLRLAIERAEAAVSSKTRFLAAASHDLLQPINAAKLLISTLQDRCRGSEFEPMLDRLEGSFGSAEQLLHSLLDISRLESADPDQVSPTTICLGTIMDGVFADQAFVAEQKNVSLDMVSSSLFVRSDPVYLLRSIQNLVVNALQYTEPGGRVLFGCRRRGDKAVLQVLDTGIGIDQKDQRRIFEEFSRAENVPPGTGMGLGLSVVDRACRLLGHKHSIWSKPGVGSVFSIEMDIVEGVAEITEPSDLDLNDVEEPLDYIVLVIENDRDVLYGTTAWLEQWGASVLPAQNAQKALEYIDELGMAPDIILADYELDNGETGLETIDLIRKKTGNHVAAMLVTADRSETLRQAAMKSDISIITKPVKLSRLRPLIHWKVNQDNTNTTSPV